MQGIEHARADVESLRGGEQLEALLERVGAPSELEAEVEKRVSAVNTAIFSSKASSIAFSFFFALEDHLKEVISTSNLCKSIRRRSR